MKTRRQFLTAAGMGLMAAGTGAAYGAYTDSPAKRKSKGEKTTDLFGIGMAGYTFAKLTIDKTIEIMQRTGVKNLSLKDIHLPLDSNQEAISSVFGKFRDAGINVYTVGVVYMKSEQAVNQAFEYAKMAGVKLIVCAPNYELLSLVEKKVKEYDIKTAIHNHGPDNPLYPNPTDIWNHIKDMDSRMGICIDIGHTTRDGHDPCLDMERYAKRINDIHIKDVSMASKEGKTIEMGRGVINIPEFVRILRKVKYSGMCSLEFEKDMNDPIAGIAESIGYFKGVMAGLTE